MVYKYLDVPTLISLKQDNSFPKDGNVSQGQAESIMLCSALLSSHGAVSSVEVR